MHYSAILKKSVLFAVFAIFAIAGCKKTDSNPLSDEDDAGGYASDASRIEWLSDDAISIADAAGNFYNGVYMKGTNTFGTCALVSIDTVSSPHVLIIRFGSENCMCLDGKNRRGNIVVRYSGKYTDSNKLHTISFQDYYVNDIRLSGTTKVTRVDTTVVGNWYYRVLVDDTMTTKPNEYVTWKGTLTRKWIAGYNTGDRSDDIYSVSGNTTIVRANAHLFAFDIQTPLQVALGCDYIQSGVANVTGFNGDTRVLNYALGNNGTPGQCDNRAQLNIGVHVYQLVLY